jgi:hypothetical protein
MDKDEFFDVYRLFRPHAEREKFEREWEEFQRFKREYLSRRMIQ